MTAGQPRAPVGGPLAHRRERAVPEVVRGVHREVLSGTTAARSTPVPRAGTWRPAARTPTGPCPPTQRDGYYTRPVLVVNGFTVLNEPQGEPQLQAIGGFGAGKWKNDSQLWWTGARPGAKLELGLPAAAGRPLRSERPPDQGPRLRHRAAFAGRQEGRRADRPVQPGRRPHRGDLVGHPTT